MITTINQAVILAGGKGERLKPLTDNCPKPMVEVLNKPFLCYLIENLKKQGIKKVLLLVGYKYEVLTSYFIDGSHNDVSIDFVIGTSDDNTGKRVIDAYPKLDDHFLLMYGDNFWQPDLKEMIRNYNYMNVSATTTVFDNKNGTGEYGMENNVCYDENRLVVKYDKSRKSKKLNGVDIGFFIVSKQIISKHITGNISFEEDILTNLVRKKQLGVYVTSDQYYFITNIRTLQIFETYLIEQAGAEN